MCAADSGKDLCGADDGGPLFDVTENVLVGVASWGYCDGSVPVVFARIANQWIWIQTTICADHSNPKPEFCPTSRPVSQPAKPPMKPKRPTNKNSKKGGNGGKGGKKLL